MAIELLEAARFGTASHAEMARYMDGAIAEVILFQTMTTDDRASGRATGEIHTGVKVEVVRADADLFAESFNACPVVRRNRFNYDPGVAQPRILRKDGERVDLKVLADTDAFLDALGWRRTLESFLAAFGTGFEHHS